MRNMPSKNERVELEMQILRYRQVARQVDDEQSQQGIVKLIAEAEKNLREIDE